MFALWAFMNSRPSTPLCQNCAMTRLFCEAERELNRRKCCPSCEHHDLPPDIRPTP